MPGDKKQPNIPSLPKGMTPEEMRKWKGQAERALKESGALIQGIRKKQERERKESINELVEKLKDAVNKAGIGDLFQKQYDTIQNELTNIQLPRLTNDEASYICTEVLAGNTDERHSFACSAFLNKLANDTGNKVEVTIDGNGKDDLGAFLEKGVVMHINGNAGDNAGINMKGGTLTVAGDAGDYAGWGMKGGTLTVAGDAGDYAGIDMKGGTLTIEGNAGTDAGRWVKGGTLTIEGNAGDGAGEDMKGGELHIHGTVESFDKSAFEEANKGQIYLTNQKTGDKILIYNNGGGGPLWNTRSVKRLTKEAYENFKITREGYKIKFKSK